MSASPPPASRLGLFRSLLGIIAIVLLVPLGIAALRTFRDLGLARARRAHLEEKVRAAEAEVARLQRWLRDLEGDPALIERLARQDLGMVREEEIVIFLPPEPAAAVPPPAPAESTAAR